MFPDAITYLVPAQSLLERGTFEKDGKPEIERTPGYPAFLAIIQLFVGRDLRTILVTQAILLSGGVLVLYLLARRILPPVMAFLGALLAGLSPWGAFLASVPLSEGLFLSLLTLIFFTMKLTEERQNLLAAAISAAFVGLLTAATVLVRPISPLVILVGIALFINCGRKRKPALLLTTMMLLFAVTPLHFWRLRNQYEVQFNGLSTIAGKTMWHYLGSRVNAHLSGENQYKVKKESEIEEQSRGWSVQEASNEYWQRTRVLILQHPALTIYYFLLNAAEHAVHPTPIILTPAKINFHGDFLSLGLLWGGMVVLALFGVRSLLNKQIQDFEYGIFDQFWILTMLVICGLLTLSSGISFGQGSRLRAPLEIVVPLLAASGVLQLVRKCQHRGNKREPLTQTS